jgi:hypothetical protein
MMNRNLRYLVKWKDFGLEHNSWEPWDFVHSPDLLVTDFHRKHPGAARHIRAIRFNSMPFRLRVPGRHPVEDVRGHPIPADRQPAPAPVLPAPAPQHTGRYVIPQRRWADRSTGTGPPAYRHFISFLFLSYLLSYHFYLYYTIRFINPLDLAYP